MEEKKYIHVVLQNPNIGTHEAATSCFTSFVNRAFHGIFFLIYRSIHLLTPAKKPLILVFVLNNRSITYSNMSTSFILGKQFIDTEALLYQAQKLYSFFFCFSL